MYVINKVDVLLKVPSQCCQSLVCTSNVCDLVDDKQCAIFIVALQMQPRWEAWKESLHLPGPIGDTKAFTVARDMSSSYKGHLLVISQVVSQLGQHMTLGLCSSGLLQLVVATMTATMLYTGGCISSSSTKT